MFALVCMLLASGVAPAHANEWLAPDHNRRLRLLYDNPTNSSVSDFPVLVQIDDTRVDLSRLDGNRRELLFFDEAGNALDHYVDDVDDDGTSWVWVRLPTLVGDSSGPDGAFWMYYDSPTTPPALSQAEEFAAANAVWNDDWRAVVTLDSVNRMATDRYPISYQGNHAVDVDGRIGSARYFDDGDYVQFEGEEDDFDLDELTVSAWVRRDGWSEDWAPVIAKGDDAWRLHREGGSNTIVLSYDRTNGNNISPPANGNVPNNTWTHIHATYESGGRHRMYIDGQQVTDINDQGNIDNQGERVRIGNNEDADRFWRGEIDHVTVHDVARTPDWVTIDHASHTNTLIVEWCSSVPGPGGTVHDFDGDGVPCDVDCDDGDGEVGRYYEDLDGDGFSDGSTPVFTCSDGPNVTTDLGDCDDTDQDVSPDAAEVCDGIDNDCEGGVDDGLLVSRFPDADDDGLGDDSVVAVQVCPDEPGFVDNNDDCDDDTDTIGAAGTWFLDADGDGFGTSGTTLEACDLPTGYVAGDGDCDDTRASDNPGAPEVCDSFDNDCDGDVDVAAVNAPNWYPDNDGDGQGADTPFVTTCARPNFHVPTPGDCDDTVPSVFTGATEQCNLVDDDCDGAVDEGVVEQFWFVDGDGDGVGDAQGPLESCEPAQGEVGVGGDCDDSDADVNPNADEVCDGIDNDCDGTIDQDASDSSTWIIDDDDDGFGAIGGATTEACVQPTGYAEVGGDCDDDNPVRRPGEPEVCDGFDNDCNSVVDDSDERLDLWLDFDMDSFGDSSLPPVFQCPTPGYVDNGLDCQDASDHAYPPFGNEPGGTEVCDGLDNDCDGLLDDEDDDIQGEEYWEDSDGDGFGDPSSDSVVACSPPAGTVADDTDCNDGDQAVNPGATEVDGNGLDDDCDGVLAGEDTGMVDTGIPLDTASRDTAGDGTGVPEPPDPPVSTGDTAGEPTIPVRPPSSSTGCGCSNGSGGPPMGLLLLAGVLLVGRRGGPRAR